MTARRSNSEWGYHMAPNLTVERMLTVLRETIVGTVRRDGPDLSARQFGIFLVTYLEDGPHTVRELAARLEVSKPAITRSLDRLVELGLSRRAPDPRDRRSVLVQRTRKGSDFLNFLRKVLTEASADPSDGPGNGTAKPGSGKARDNGERALAG
jgi:DNA-binding MarR family transcriptional regulator